MNQQIGQHRPIVAPVLIPTLPGHITQTTHGVAPPAVGQTHVAATPQTVVTPVAVPTPKPPAIIKPVVSPTPVSVAPSKKPPAPVVATSTVSFVQPNVLPVLRPPSTSSTQADAMKKLSLTSGLLDLGKPNIPMAKPDMPIPIKPRPYGSFPTSSPFHLPEKPPEGHTHLATHIIEHLKTRPPIHEPDEVIAEDLSIKDAKEK